MNNVYYICTQVLSENLWGMRLVVLGKPEYRDMISHVQTGTVRTGIANTLGMRLLVIHCYWFRMHMTDTDLYGQMLSNTGVADVLDH